MRAKRRDWSLTGLAFLMSLWAIAALPGCNMDFYPFNTSAVSPQRLSAPFLRPGEVPRTGGSMSVKVGKIFDGDTFAFKHDHLSYHVRLSGIDAPERMQPFGEDSRLALLHMIEGQTVRLDVLKIDAYGRLVCKVSLSDSSAKDVSLMLLEKGLAWHFKRYQKDQHPDDRELYARQEDRARGAHQGLWQEATPQAPWLYREQQRALKNGPG